MKRVGLIPLKRLKQLPEMDRPKHEFCFFLHDECVRAFKEYAEADAHRVKVEFERVTDADRFAEIADENDTIEALQKLGYVNAAKKVILNTITMAMISDCLLHIYEALMCLEKRKVVVALNLLRKPLKDSLPYLMWMYSNSDEFYSEFMKGNPEELSQTKLGNIRERLFLDAIRKLDTDTIFDAKSLNEIIFNRKSPDSLEGYFQHAVHLITIKYDVTRTAPQNFNFIFKSPEDDDIYETIYRYLPYVLCFLSHVVIELLDEVKDMDKGAKSAFRTRAVLGMYLIEETEYDRSIRVLKDVFGDALSCPNCSSDLKITRYNATKIILTETFRCTNCRQIHSLPLSYLF